MVVAKVNPWDPECWFAHTLVGSVVSSSILCSCSWLVVSYVLEHGLFLTSSIPMIGVHTGRGSSIYLGSVRGLEYSEIW